MFAGFCEIVCLCVARSDFALCLNQIRMATYRSVCDRYTMRCKRLLCKYFDRVVDPVKTCHRCAPRSQIQAVFCTKLKLYFPNCSFTYTPIALPYPFHNARSICSCSLYKGRDARIFNIKLIGCLRLSWEIPIFVCLKRTHHWSIFALPTLFHV